MTLLEIGLTYQRWVLRDSVKIQNCLPFHNILMCMPLVREGTEGPEGYYRKEWLGYKGQRWRIVCLKTGVIIRRMVIEGDPRFQKRFRFGEFHVIFRTPDWVFPRITP